MTKKNRILKFLEKVMKKSNIISSQKDILKKTHFSFEKCKRKKENKPNEHKAKWNTQYKRGDYQESEDCLRGER